MELQIGEVRTFRTHDGRLITGKVVAVINRGAYLVVGNDSICCTYTDGLYRFSNRNIVR